METLRSKVESALKKFVDDPEVDRLVLDDDVPPGKVAGTLISTQFEGKPSTERQDLIWDELDAVLDTLERSRVVIILAQTPEENRLYSESA